MDGQLLANSLVSLKGSDLRLVYALLLKTNIGHLVTSKTKDLFTKTEQDHFTQHLEEEAKKLADEKDSVLQVNLFLELTRLLKLKGTKYSLQKEIEDQCATIVNEVHAGLKKQDKQFRAFAEKNPQSSKLQQMIQYQMGKIFGKLDDNFKDFSIEDQTKFASQVNEYIHSLPAEKQLKIKEKLGINDLTDEMLRRALMTSGTSIVFAIIVEVSGFVFYTTATSIVASFAGLLGLTLPFGFYTGLTSTIAVLASPVFVIPLLLGGGALLVNQQNISLKKKLLPIILMQITLSYMGKETKEVQFNWFIKEWQKRYDESSVMHKTLEELVVKREELELKIYGKEKSIKELTAGIKNDENQLAFQKQKIAAELKQTNLDDLEINSSFLKHKQDYERTMDEIHQLVKTKKGLAREKGLLTKLNQAFTTITSTFDIREKEKSAELLLGKMVEDILSSNSSYLQNERETVNHINQRLIQQTAAQNIAEAERQNLESMVKAVNRNHKQITKRLKAQQKENYGLSDLFAE